MTDTFDYAEAQADALELIAEFGQSVTLTRSVPGAYDTATGTTGAATVTTQTVLAVEEAYHARSIDGTLILAGDKKLLVSPLTAAGAAISAPKAEDTVTFSGDASPWTVKSVEALAPAGTPVLYTLQLRRA